MAALKGATTELRKWEGMAFDPGQRRLYVAVSAVANGMKRADPEWDLAGVDHIGMAENLCGMVMALEAADGPVQDSDGKPIESPWVMASAAPYLTGEPLPASGPDSPLACALGTIANPDNLAFIPEAGILLIAEDTHGHDNNVLWASDVTRGTLTRVLIAPARAEVAGLNWFPNIGGWGYLTVTIQYPDADWAREGEVLDVPMSTSGVLGPFPVP